MCTTCDKVSKHILIVDNQPTFTHLINKSSTAKKSTSIWTNAYLPHNKQSLQLLLFNI